MPSRIALRVVFSIISVGCGGAAPAASAENAPSENGPPAGEVAATEGAEAPAPSGLVFGAVSWELFQPTRIDDAGDVFHGSQRLGRLSTDGALTEEDGTVTARLDEEGWVWMGEDRSHMRIVGDRVLEGSSEMMRIENGQLVSGRGDEEERIPVSGFRAELARSVLFVSAVTVAGMAAAFAH